MEARLWMISGIALVLFVVLGVSVSGGPAGRIDEAGVARGAFVQLAQLFTLSGRFLPLLLLGVLALGLAVAGRLPMWVPVAVLISQAASQSVVEVVKGFFHRARPDQWISPRDLGFSYPSGHASTAVVFYGAWLLVVLHSPIPKPAKIVVASAIAAWMLGIAWSRIALGAHYFTDVAGGALFGIFWLAAVLAVLAHFNVEWPALR